MKNNYLVEEYLKFMEMVMTESVTPLMWKEYTINHYSNEAVERARRELVRTIIKFDPKGEGKPLSLEVKEELGKIVNELKL